MNSEQLITVKALAKILSVSERTIHRFNSSGKIPAPLHIGGSLRFRVCEIDVWIDADCPDRQAWEAIKNSKNGWSKNGSK